MNAKYFIIDEGWRLTADKTAILPIARKQVRCNSFSIEASDQIKLENKLSLNYLIKFIGYKYDMQTGRSPTFPHFFDLLFISWNAGSWDEEITNILSSEGNTSNRFKIRSSEFVTIIFIQKTYPCQRLRQYDHTLDSCGFSSPESTEKNEYNTLYLASDGKKQHLNSNLC